MSTLLKKETMRLIAAALVASALGLVTTACGGGSMKPGTGDLDDNSGNDTSGTDDPGLGDDYSNPDASYPSISEDFEIEGGNGSFTKSGIYTDSVLKVTVTAGQPTTVPGTGYTAMFSCLKYKVTVGTKSYTVFVSNTGSAGWGNCYGAVTSKTLDFSDQLYAGHPRMSVKVSNPMYDNCRLYGNIYGTGCPLTSVYNQTSTHRGHIVTGNLEIHTDISN